MGPGEDPVLDLVQRHLPLVRALARRHLGRGETADDLVQVGAVALVAAARRFDPGRGVPFAAYAAPTVDGELRRHLRDRSSTVRVPRRQRERAAALRTATAAASQRLGREPSLAEAAAAAGLSTDEARTALAASEPALPLGELAGRASTTAADELEACEDRELLRSVLAALPPRERELVRLRFAGDLSQAEIAGRLCISQSQASRLLAATLEKLRRSLAVADEAA